MWKGKRDVQNETSLGVSALEQGFRREGNSLDDTQSERVTGSQ